MKDETKNPISEEAFHECEKERDEYLAGWKRTKADLINYKKEEAKRIQSFITFSNENLVRELLPVLDSFEEALKNNKTEKPLEGIQIMYDQLNHILKHAGLLPMPVSQGDAFDPGMHEAISEIPSTSPPGTIAEEIYKGYFFHDKVLRPARVAISKEKGQEEKTL